MKIQETIDATLARFSARLATRAVIVAPGAAGASAPTLAQHLPAGRWLIAADDNTWAAAGEQLARDLDAHALPWARYAVPTPEGERWPGCDDDSIAAYQAAVADGGYVAGVAVGSGTINDIVKQACHNLGLPMACVATSPSMNGYTSAIAAVLSQGVKTTIASTPPLVVIADTAVLAASPYRMIASGLGDLLSKPVSNADWTVSARLVGSPHSAEAMEVIELGSAMLDDVAARLPARDLDAVAGLTGSLILSGLAMSIAGSSSPASGGEHLISHYIDMTAHTFDLPYDFHGCQVGVGTLTAAYLYERLRAYGPDAIDVEARVAALPAWEDHAATITQRFGPLAHAVLPHAQRGYPTPDALRARLTTLKQTWHALFTEASRTLRTRASIEQELLDAQAPVRYAQLDVGRSRAREAIVWSKDIRNRYTILHVCWELGMLEQWADEALELLYDGAPS
jgi:glycerol-1-phosphate dehydrogenase [NAD(P)+]